MVHGPLSIGFARQESQEAFGRVQTSISPSGKWVHKAHFFFFGEKKRGPQEGRALVFVGQVGNVTVSCRRAGAPSLPLPPDHFGGSQPPRVCV